MPELPEVEIITTGLNRVLRGGLVSSVSTRNPGCIRGRACDFQPALTGRMVRRVRRRAKLAILDLDQDQHLVFHLKMTGKLLFDPAAECGVDKHTHLIINFSDRTRLLFHDVRKFGYCSLLHSSELREWAFYRELGPEPLQMGSEEFSKLFKDKKTAVKSALLNQKVIAGIGNIYADESLHLAGIHPTRPCRDIPADRLDLFLRSLHKVLKLAIESGGSSFRDYVDSLGKQGSFQDAFRVYGRKGLPCRTCGTPLESCKVAGRTTVYCPKCQT